MGDGAKLLMGWACRTVAMIIAVYSISNRSWQWLAVSAYLFVESIGWEIKRIYK